MIVNFDHEVCSALMNFTQRNPQITSKDERLEILRRDWNCNITINNDADDSIIEFVNETDLTYFLLKWV